MQLNLISSPRNISTALMYSFAQRTDTVVLDEPFYAVYLHKSGARHPGREEVLKHLPKEESEVYDLIRNSCKQPVLFIKNMAHHMEVLEQPIPEGSTSIFLIRDPALILASYTQVINKPEMRDIGIQYQYHLFKQATAKGETPVVVDSGLLLENPERVLRQLCHRCGLAFQENMLRWPEGPKPYDGVWARHWYTNVHHSRGFERQKTTSRALPERLKSLYTEALSYYEKLLPFSLKA